VRCRDEDKKLILVPAVHVAANFIRVLEDQPIKPKIHQDPRQRRDALDNEISTKRHAPHKAVTCERHEDAEIVGKEHLGYCLETNT
jgi:hypothetical protein